MAEGFRTIFDSVFDNASPDEMGCFLKNELVPFEYCERAIRMKGIGWRNKLLVAKRRDCPVDVLVSLCRKGGERFLDDLFKTMKVIPEVAIRELFKKDWTMYHLASYWRLPDDIKAEMFERFVIRDENGRIVSYDYGMDNFLECQVYLPDICWKDMDAVLDAYRARLRGDMRRNLVEIVRPMQTPLDDDYAMTIIDDANCRNWHKFMKLAANPSISDYAMMEIRVKCPEHAMEDVNEILAKREPARDEYRRRHE